MLVRLNAPLVRLDPDNDVVETEAFAIDPRTEQLVARQPAGNGIAATGDVQSLATVDFPGARWVTSPNYSSRSGTAVREVAIHTMQGSYAGSARKSVVSGKDVAGRVDLVGRRIL